MYFRFGSALALLILVSIAGVAIEKECLALRRSVTRQQYRQTELAELSARARLRTQQLGAPIRLIEAIEQGRIGLVRPDLPRQAEAPRLPLLTWQRGDGRIP
jgi:hypothetical protein